MNLWIARRAPRKGLYVPMGGTKVNPSLMFFLPKTDRSELDEIVRANLAKQGVTKESDVQAILSKADADYEHRIKVAEADKEVRRLMALKAQGATLMQVGHKKWKQAFYRPIK